MILPAPRPTTFLTPLGIIPSDLLNKLLRKDLADLSGDSSALGLSPNLHSMDLTSLIPASIKRLR